MSDIGISVFFPGTEDIYDPWRIGHVVAFIELEVVLNMVNAHRISVSGGGENLVVQGVSCALLCPVVRVESIRLLEGQLNSLEGDPAKVLDLAKFWQLHGVDVIFSSLNCTILNMLQSQNEQRSILQLQNWTMFFRF